MDRHDPNQAGLRDVARRRSAQVAVARLSAPASFGSTPRLPVADLAAALAIGHRWRGAARLLKRRALLAH